MALLKSSFGELSGTFGELVFRNRHGKTFVYKKPLHHKISNSAAAVRSRNMFATAHRFARCIRLNELLKGAWKSFPHKSDMYINKILACNSPLIDNLLFTVNNMITPDTRSENPVKNIIMHPERINVIVSDDNELLQKDTTIYEHEKLIIFAAVLDPAVEGLLMCDIVELYTGKIAPGMNFFVEFTKEQSELFCNYERYIIYAATVECVRADRFIWTKTRAWEGRIH